MKTLHLAVAGIVLCAVLAQAPCPVVAQTPAVKPIVLKGTLSKDDPLDRLRQQSHHQVHEVDLQKNQVYLIELESEAFDTYLRLEDAAGKVLAENDDISDTNLNSRLGYVVDKTAKYRVVVTSFQPGRTGVYQATVLPLQARGKPLISNHELTEKSPQSQGRYFQLHEGDLQTGLVYRIEAQSRDFAPLLVLKKGQQLLARDEAGKGSPSLVVFTPEVTGRYFVEVLGGPPGATGAYQFTIQRYEVPGRQTQAVKVIHPEVPPTVIYGQLQRTDPLDRVRKQSHCQVHEVVLEAGKAYSIDLKSLGFDPFVRLEDAQGKELASDDDSGGYLDAWLSFAPPRMGTYRLIVTSFEPAQAGDYLLTVQTFARQDHVQQRHRMELQAVLWDQQGVKEHRRGVYLLAAEYMKKALQWRQGLYPEKSYPRGHPHCALSLNNLGILYEGRGENGPALKHFREALELFQKLYPEEDYPRGCSQMAVCLHNLGSLYQARGEYGPARNHWRKALEMRQKLYPEKDFPRGHAQLAESLNSLGVLYFEEGEYDLALKHHREALQMYRKLYPEKDFPRGHADLANSLNNLGALYKAQGEHGPALNHFREALEIVQKLYPEKDFPRGHADLANSLNNLGSQYEAQGEDSLALKYFLEALQMCRTLYPEKDYPRGHLQFARSLNNLGGLYQLQGDYGLAQKHIREALEMRQKLYPEKDYPHGHADLAFGLNNLGGLYQVQGEYGPALKHFREALQMYRSLYPEKDYPRGHTHLANSLNNLGGLYQAQGEYEPALKHFREALEMYRRLYPEKDYPRGHADLANSLNSIGLLYKAHGEYGPALKHYREALQMYRRLYPEKDYPRGHADLAGSLNVLGNLHQAQGEYGSALTHLREALEMFQKLYPEKDFPRGHPGLAGSLHNIGDLHRAQGEYLSAQKHLCEALKMDQQLMDQFADLASEAEALNFASSLPETRDELLSVSQHLPYQQMKTYRLLWDGRSLLTRIIERRHRDLLASSDEKTKELAGKLTSVRQRLAHLLLKPLQDLDKNRALVEKLNRDKEDHERQIAANLKLERTTATETTTPEQLQAALPQGAIFLDLIRYLRFEQDAKIKGQKGLKWIPSYGAFVVGRDQLQWVDLGAAEPVEKDIALWRAALVASERDKLDLGIPHAQRVRRRLWDRLSQALPKDTHTLYLAAEGDLTKVPWGALPGDRAGRILLEDYSFTLVPHGSFLLQQLTRKATPAAADHLLLVGDVRYDSAAAGKSASGKESAPALTRSPLLEGEKTWQALPGSVYEIGQIRALAGSRTSLVIKGEDATGERLHRDLPQVRLAHLATHGFFADKKFRSAVLQTDEKLFERRMLAFNQIGERQSIGARNPLVLSGLVLAGANHPDTPDRGILTADAIVGLDLRRLELAVLSACETGLGEVAGGEGVYGLQRAFHVAGCRQVVASLWHVDDAATAALMVLFYRKQWEEGLAPTEALRQAQLAVYHHPEAIPKWAKGERGPNLKKTQTGTGQSTLTPPLSGARTPARYWAAFVMSGANPIAQPAERTKK